MAKHRLHGLNLSGTNVGSTLEERFFVCDTLKMPTKEIKKDLLLNYSKEDNNFSTAPRTTYLIQLVASVVVLGDEALQQKSAKRI